jgi:hypothetical protein
MGFTTTRKTRITAKPQEKKRFMKASTTKFAKAPQTPVCRKTLHRLRPNPKAVTLSLKSQKRDNICSKSRDPREDRGACQMKTTYSSQALFRICALL